MIDKLNFYDIYGYFLPGATLLAVLWLPLGLVRKAWPPTDLGSAVIAIALAYIAGYLVEMIASNVLPFSIAGADGHRRNPSDVVLDPDSPFLTKTVKTNIAAMVKARFCLDINVEMADNEDIDSARRDAFFLARQSLIQASEASYAEHSQGMYALTCGLTGVFALGFMYLAGWGLSHFHPAWEVPAAILTLIFLLLAINTSAYLLRSNLQWRAQFRLEFWCAFGLLMSALGIGYLLGRRYHLDHSHAALLWLLAAIMLLSSLRCYRAYHDFARDFGLKVWRDFLVSRDQGKGDKGKNDDKRNKNAPSPIG